MLRLLFCGDEGSTFGWARFQGVHAVQHTPGKDLAYLVWEKFRTGLKELVHRKSERIWNRNPNTARDMWLKLEKIY